MQYATCPECNWTLGVPSKLVGKNVSCPKCAKTFLADGKNLSDEKPKKKRRKPPEPAKPATLKPRAMPLPSAISKKGTESEKLASTEQGSSESEAITSAEFQSTINDLAPPSRKSKTRKPKTVESETKPAPAEPTPAEHKTIQKTTALPDPPPPKTAVLPTPSPLKEEAPPTTAVARTTPQPAPAGTATIITTVPDDSDFAKNGKLPTLQLKDDEKPVAVTKEMKRNPIFLGLLVCFSLVLSGLMVFMIDFDGEATNEKSLGDVRQKLQKFYETRIDVQLRPYQLELREAQLAHSRRDREGEIRELRKVMARFRAEDRNKFVGVTGSPSADKELERLVSALLGGELP